ncbi:tetratricopeptide repeat protein [Pseudomonas sp. JV449]|uniref:tetratricopeptide repeat protein n=1 Tax=Pseudomonas sp. JV449 TaxID=1890658 RepID=UPI0028E0FC23|nr:tetratricopeptide repeat protein [Pseudomonas sp. JV449]MDT9630960.1 tetratricopeptide repeat protein [Pseudomonas sp. JV449]
MAVQLTTSSAITDQINLLSESRQPSEMEIRRVKREIEQLKNSDIAQHYMLLGMLYSVLGDEDESRANHEKSLKLSGDVVFLENYAFSLKRLGRSAEALSQLSRAFDICPSLEIFEEVAQAMLYAGDLDDYERVAEKFKKANPEINFEKVYSARYINGVKNHLTAASVSSSDFHRSMALVENVLTEHGHRSLLQAIRLSPGRFDDVSHVNIRIIVSVDSSDVLTELNERIADAMVSAQDLEAWNRLVFTVADWVPEHEEEVA